MLQVHWRSKQEKQEWKSIQENEESAENNTRFNRREEVSQAPLEKHSKKVNLDNCKNTIVDGV
jgi:hypothetical protein